MGGPARAGRRPARADAQNKSARAAEPGRSDVARARAAWRAARPRLGPARLVFRDETWAATNRTRRSARGPRGGRAVCPVPCGHGKTTTVVAARRCDRRTAPRVIDGAMTGDHFGADVRPVLVPERRPGGVVVPDSRSGRQRAEAAAAIRAAGAEVRFPPPSSPDRNPIELAFSKRKAPLRAAAERTVEGLWGFLGRALDAFTPDECRNDLRHRGYDATAHRRPL